LRRDSVRNHLEVFMFGHPTRQADKGFDNASHNSEDNIVAFPETVRRPPPYPPGQGSWLSYLGRCRSDPWTRPAKPLFGTTASL
jgi:hypothetical protein